MVCRPARTHRTGTTARSALRCPTGAVARPEGPPGAWATLIACLCRALSAAVKGRLAWAKQAASRWRCVLCIAALGIARTVSATVQPRANLKALP